MLSKVVMSVPLKSPQENALHWHGTCYCKAKEYSSCCDAAALPQTPWKKGYRSLLKQRSSQMSCLMLKHLMYGILPCYSTFEQILPYNTTRYSTAGPGQRWEEEEAVSYPAQTIAWGLGSFCVPSAGHSLFYTCTCANEFFKFCTGLSSGSTTL